MTCLCVIQGPQRPAPHDGIFLTGRVKEAALPDGVGGIYGGRDGDHSLCDPSCPGRLLQVA